MQHDREELSAQDIENLKNELMMPAGELGAVLIAALLIVASIWFLPGFVRSAPDARAAGGVLRALIQQSSETVSHRPADRSGQAG
jgi:hypothetical protein